MFFIPLLTSKMEIRLEKIAKELLIDEDFLVIPNFGGFVTHFRPAVLEPTKNILIPPGKNISFNVQLSKNDGFLAQSIVVKTGLSYQDALKAIEAKVEFWQNELAATNYLELDGLGSFVLNKEGNLVFEQFNETNFASTSFGLTNVHAKPVQRIDLASRIERGLDKKIATPRLFRIAKTSSIAAGIALIIGFGLFQTFSTMGTDVQQQSLSIPPLSFGSSTVNEKTHVPLEHVDPVNTVFNEEDRQEFRDRGHLDEEPNLERIQEIQAERKEKEKLFARTTKTSEIEKSKVIVKSDSQPTSLPYHIIAGCFGIKSNAHKMVKQLQKTGYSNAQIVGRSKSGLYRVAYGSYGQKIKALKALAKIKLSHNSKAWMAED